MKSLKHFTEFFFKKWHAAKLHAIVVCSITINETYPCKKGQMNGFSSDTLCPIWKKWSWWSPVNKVLFHHLGCLLNSIAFLYICLRFHGSYLRFKVEKGEDRHARDSCFQTQENINTIWLFQNMLTGEKSLWCSIVL